jgi:hypothetical protein
MIKHKFSKGDRVLARPDASNANMRPGVYTIVSVLPVAGHRAAPVLSDKKSMEPLRRRGG